MKIKNEHQIRIVTDEFIYVEENGDSCSISMTIDEIIKDIKRKVCIDRRRVIYKDNFGGIDEIVIKNGEFHSFRVVQKSDRVLWQIHKMLGR